ncbi:MAG: TonB-dependent receptor [Tannerella sp.]|nr:TonB-dependent receptor [Tannerella sp.]
MQQSKGNTITGTVSDENGEPIPGATITVKGTTRGVITGEDGTFTIQATPENQLEISYLGYQKLTMPVGKQTYINVALTPNVNELDEVTIVAFSKQKKESVIASISTVNPSDLKIPSSNLTTALAGRISGVIAYQRSGEPGLDNADYFIRGVTTFGYKKDPLILLDNNEISSTELARIQPDDIATFSIMKDAAATALYGSRGANGVILVTTKEGVEGKAKLTFRFEESGSTPVRKVELADPVTYMKLHNEAVRTRDPLGLTYYSQSKIDNTIKGVNPYVYPANDWYDILFKDFATSQRANFNLSGGGKIANYYIAGTFNNDNGNLNVDKLNNFNSNVNVQRFMLRTNVGINVTPTTTVKVRLQGKFDDYNGPIDGGEATYKKVMTTNPVLFPPYFLPDEQNLFTQHVLFGNYDKGQYLNPYADMVKGYKESTDSQMFAQFEMEQKLDFFLKGLAFRGMFNTSRYSYFDVQRYYSPFYYAVSLYDKSTDAYTLSLLNEQSGREYLDYHEGDKKVTSSMYGESSLSWNNSFNDRHEVSMMTVFTIRNYLAANAGNLQKSLPTRNLNLAGRATYAYDSRYFFEFNFGYNGSERFAAKERFGFFPSGGVGWIVSNEPFFSDDLKKNVSKLKLKGTYGISGNDAIGSEEDRFFYLSNVNMDNSSRGMRFGTYGNTTGGHYLSGISVSRYPNEDITWEISKKLNLGIELNLLNKLEIQFDYFTEDRSNILMNRSYIPATMGLQAGIKANVGEAKSHGVDMSLDYTHSITNDLWVQGIANFTYATSEFSVYEEPDYSATPWKSRMGLSLNQSFGYVAERLFVDEEEIKNSPEQFGNYMAGDIKYKDINEDGKITELDQVPIGYPTSPEIVYGFGLSAGYKNLDVSCFFQGLARESFWINLNDDPANGIIGTAPFIGQQRALLKVYADDHWSEDNRNLDALYPRLSETHISNNEQRSTWFMQNGAFLRLKSVEVGYTFPQKTMQRLYVSGLRLYFSGTNLLTFSKFKLWDPEMAGNGLGYPVQRVFNLGVQLSF